jgi:hypothetical protein
LSEIILIIYLVVVVLAALRMRQIGVKLFDLLAFVVNVSAIAWLLFLYIVLSSEQGAQGWWVPWGCMLLSVLLIPITIRGIALGIKLRNDVKPMSHVQGFARLDKNRYLNTELPLLVIWFVLYQRAPFRSHIWLTLLCGVVSAALVAAILALVSRSGGRA